MFLGPCLSGLMAVRLFCSLTGRLATDHLTRAFVTVDYFNWATCVLDSVVRSGLESQADLVLTVLLLSKCKQQF